MLHVIMSVYTVGNHVIRMIGFKEFRAGIRTKQVNKTYHTFLNTQPIFIKQNAHTSKLFEANVHIKVTPQYAVVFHTSPNKYCFQYFDCARISAAENHCTL